MKYIIIAVVVLIARASLELSNFNVSPHTSAIHQINSTMIMTGDNKGQLRLYTVKGQFIKEQHFHNSTVISIHSYQISNTNLLITADESGVIAIWDENIHLSKSIDLKIPIQQVILYIESGQEAIIISTGSQIHFYDLVNLVPLKKINLQGKISKIKLTNDYSMVYLLQMQGKVSINIYNQQNQQSTQLFSRQEKISNFALYQFNQTQLLYVIDGFGNLNIYSLHKNTSFITSDTNEQQNSMFPSNYIDIGYFQNQKDLPMFVAIKQNGRVQIFLASEVLMFFQVNYQIKLLESNIQNMFALLSTNDRLAIVTMKDTSYSQDIWIVLFIVCLLSMGLYLCLSDCCPGIYQKWRQGRQRKQIEMALYKQKSQLDNF